jgi:hypothetical protein
LRTQPPYDRAGRIPLSRMHEIGRGNLPFLP